jgi:hypothetical protein
VIGLLLSGFALGLLAGGTLGWRAGRVEGDRRCLLILSDLGKTLPRLDRGSTLRHFTPPQSS